MINIKYTEIFFIIVQLLNDRKNTVYTKMFGRQGGLSSSSGSGSNLVEFRAGRMNLIGKMVHPDTRKGLVYLTQSDDGLMHFCWKDRTTGKVGGVCVCVSFWCN